MTNATYCIALKPCQLAGHKFLIGERVPGDLLDEKSAARMRQMGYLSECVIDVEPLQPQANAAQIPNEDEQEPGNPTEPSGNPPPEPTEPSGNPPPKPTEPSDNPPPETIPEKPVKPKK